jgi:soluble lytic murein transglycosylase
VRTITRAIALALLLAAGSAGSRGEAPGQDGVDTAFLLPTAHPPVPDDVSRFWLAPADPAPQDEQVARFAEGVRLIQSGEAARGLALVSAARLNGSPLADYAKYYAGIALLGLGRLDEAHDSLASVVAARPRGALDELSTVALADAGLARGAPQRAEAALRTLVSGPLARADAVFAKLGSVEEAAGHREHALDAWREVHYGFPASEHAAAAREAISRLALDAEVTPELVPRELARAERLFAERQWAEARAAFAPLAGLVQRGDQEAVALRVAECDHHLQRHRAARDALRPYLQTGSPREAEARYFHLLSVRALGDREAYVRLTRALAADHPASDWTAEALNALASYHAAADRDDEADKVYRDLLRLVPRHRHAERAAWRVGWRAYRRGAFADTAAVFERAASTFPRADYRPAWLYWSGRARDRLGDRQTAAGRYRLVVADYQNSYYGRLAAASLRSRGEAMPARTAAAALPPPAPVPTEPLIRSLTAAGLYADALREVEHAQRVYGAFAVLQATEAWLRHTQAAGLQGEERFSGLRGGITLMRRAYPQFLAAGGEDLPPEVLRIIFPLDFWPLISKYAAAHGLDPYLMAALVAQESTFTAEIRSAANAYGLMQVIPATGRAVARQIGIRPFTAATLTQPEPNVRIGMRYFRDLLNRFGRIPLALAGYNAGPHRVVRWLAESPGLADDEFVDSIPFAETQNYVKRVLGTAEDYRRLYGTGILDPNVPLVASAAAAMGARPEPGARAGASR